MFGKRKRAKVPDKTDTLIGRHTEVFGDVKFTGKLHVNGTVKGNVLSDDDGSSCVQLSKHGTIEGEVRVPIVLLDGVVVGNVHAREHVVLSANARVTGNVYYTLIEMAMGAEVNGNLVHSTEEVGHTLELGHGPSLEVAGET